MANSTDLFRCPSCLNLFAFLSPLALGSSACSTGGRQHEAATSPDGRPPLRASGNWRGHLHFDRLPLRPFPSPYPAALPVFLLLARPCYPAPCLFSSYPAASAAAPPPSGSPPPPLGSADSTSKPQILGSASDPHQATTAARPPKLHSPTPSSSALPTLSTQKVTIILCKYHPLLAWHAR